MESVASERKPFLDKALIANLPLIVGFAVLAIPTCLTLAKQVWSKELGSFGPIILATGAWLIWRKLPEIQKLAEPGKLWITALLMLGGLVLYIFGSAYDLITIEAAGLYGVGIAMFYCVAGASVVIRNWFPLLYLGFMVPPPNWAVDKLTAPLKQLVSYAATGGLQAFGIPITRQGVTLIVAQYQLLVEDACSGVNSLFGLVAITLFYIYLQRNASWRYSLFLCVLIFPIAIVANIIRIVILVLLTYFFGDAVGQGFLHSTAGMVLFATALLLIFSIDSLIFWLKGRSVQRA